MDPERLRRLLVPDPERLRTLRLAFGPERLGPLLPDPEGFILDFNRRAFSVKTLVPEETSERTDGFEEPAADNSSGVRGEPVWGDNDPEEDGEVTEGDNNPGTERESESGPAPELDPKPGPEGMLTPDPEPAIDPVLSRVVEVSTESAVAGSA